MARGDEAFNVRMPAGMREELRRYAERNGRSMNAEIVARLDSSLGGASRESPLIESAYNARAHLQRVGHVLDNLIEELEKREE